MEGLAPGVYTLMISAAALDSRNVAISSRTAEMLVEIAGADGDVMQQDILLEL